MPSPVRYPLHVHPSGLRGTFIDGQVWFLSRDILQTLFGRGFGNYLYRAGEQNLITVPVDQLGLVDLRHRNARLINHPGIQRIVGDNFTTPHMEKLKIAIAEATDAILASQPPPAPEPEKTRQRPALSRTVVIGPCRVCSADGTYLGTTIGDTTVTFEQEPEP